MAARKTVSDYMADIQEMVTTTTKEDLAQIAINDLHTVIIGGIAYKECTKCGEIKIRDLFSKSSKSKSGLCATCKDCQKKWRDAHSKSRKEYSKRYREAHKEEKAKTDKEYRVKNREKLALRNKKYREENKEWLLPAKRKYYSEHKDTICAKRKEEYQQNKEKVIKRTHKYYRLNAETIIARGKIYYEKHKEEIHKRNKEYMKSPIGIEVQRKISAKKKSFGYYPLNKNFFGSDFHHLHINNSCSIGVYIPRDLHVSIYHSSTTGQGMHDINKAALLWLCEQAVI